MAQQPLDGSVLAVLSRLGWEDARPATLFLDSCSLTALRGKAFCLRDNALFPCTLLKKTANSWGIQVSLQKQAFFD